MAERFVRVRYPRRSTAPTLCAVTLDRNQAIWLMGSRLAIYPIPRELRVPCPDPECQAGVAEKCRRLGSRFRSCHLARVQALEGVGRG